MTKQQVNKGNLLIAEPFLGDPNFERSVILLCEHDEHSSLGFILNQTTELRFQDVMEDEETYTDMPLYIGGPVEQNTLHFIHRLNHLVEDSIEILDGLHWGGNYEQVKTLINIGKIQESDIRFFLGYSGWTGGQLAKELADNAWVVSQIDSKFIFDTAPKNLWRSVLRRMGGKHKIMSNYPIDPRLN